MGKRVEDAKTYLLAAFFIIIIGQEILRRMEKYAHETRLQASQADYSRLREFNGQILSGLRIPLPPPWTTDDTKKWELKNSKKE